MSIVFVVEKDGGGYIEGLALAYDDKDRALAKTEELTNKRKVI
jgi:hypothetical protein